MLYPLSYEGGVVITGDVSNLAATAPRATPRPSATPSGALSGGGVLEGLGGP